MRKKIYLSILFLFVTNFSYAGSMGYLQYGKEFVVFKDGKKVGNWPARKVQKTEEKRNPSSNIEEAAGDYDIHAIYIDDGTIRCYFSDFSVRIDWEVKRGSPISCVKK